MPLFDFLQKKKTIKTHADTDITFYMQLYKDGELARRALKRLRRSYPTSRVIVISDGDPHPDYPGLTRQCGAEYTVGERLYAVQHGGRMLHRMFEAFMQKPSRYFLKMDTDTRVDRRFRYLPAGNLIYGNMEKPNGCLQGGCILFSLEAAKKIHDSGFLLSEELKDWKKSWGQYLKPHLLEERVQKMGLIGFEWVLHWTCQALKIKTENFGEIYSRWRRGNKNRFLRHAFVHPDKKMPLHDR